MYVILNVLGLTVGLACFSVVALFVKGEFSYDLHHKNYQNIYRAVNEFSSVGSSQPYASAITSGQLGPMLHRDYPEIQDYVRFRKIPDAGPHVAIRVDEKAYFWDGDEILLADENVFEVFTHNYIYGNPEGALQDPTSITISRTLSQRYFGNSNPVGKTLLVGQKAYTINLVFEDIPLNSHLQYQALLSLNQLATTDPASPDARFELGFPSVFTYLLLSDNAAVSRFSEIGEDFVSRYMTGSRFGNYSTRFYIEPMSDLYSKPTAQDAGSVANYFLIISVSIIAVLVLLVACVNYVNLSTARSTKIVRKVRLQRLLGASRLRIFSQLIAESVIFTSLAFIFAVSVVELALMATPISQLFGKQSLSLFADINLTLSLACLSVVIAVLAGIYPALHLSSKSISNWKLSNTHVMGRSQIIRKFLVFTQFTVSLIVLTNVMIMYLQIDYLNSRSLGFEKKNKLTIRVQGARNIERLNNLINPLMQYPSIINASVTTTIPGEEIPYQPLNIDNNQDQLERDGLRRIGIDEHFLDTLRIELPLGKNLSSGLSENSIIPVLVNQATVSNYGWDNPIGKRIQWNGRNNGVVVGVTNDFNFQGLHNSVEPLFLYPHGVGIADLKESSRANLSRLLIIDYIESSHAETLNIITNEWNLFDPASPLALKQLENSINDLYLSERKQISLIGLLASICIFLSCLGLFGLVTFSTESRTKEIGIRKILGADTWQIITMLFKQILALIVLSSIAASFISYGTSEIWLEQFYYRLVINPIIFLTPLSITVVLAFVTMASQSYSTAQRNPIEALRYE